MQLPKQDHYEIARDAALQKLRDDLDAARLETLGARRDPETGRIVLPTLCWEIEVLPEPFEMCLLPDREPVAISWQIIALNYLAAPQPQPPHGFVSFADFAGRTQLPERLRRPHLRAPGPHGRARCGRVRAGRPPAGR